VRPVDEETVPAVRSFGRNNASIFSSLTDTVMVLQIQHRWEGEMARRTLGITVLWMVVALTVPPPGFPSDACEQAKKNFITAEKEWSSVNADITILRDELEKLRGLRWRRRRP